MNIHRQPLLWAVAGLVAAAAAHAAEPQDIIDYRIANMKASAGHMYRVRGSSPNHHSRFGRSRDPGRG